MRRGFFCERIPRPPCCRQPNLAHDAVMFWTLDALNLFEHAAARRYVEAWDARNDAVPPPHNRERPSLKARTEREARRMHLWAARKDRFSDALLAQRRHR